jgi:hypothetical protein
MAALFALGVASTLGVLRPTCKPRAVVQCSAAHVLRPEGKPRAVVQCSAAHVLRPEGKPRAVVHFIGGAFIGAAPQLGYAQLLDRLTDANYAVVATSYRLGFDYLTMCDEVLSASEPALAELRAEFGPLPVLGVGHSCGALLHVLLCSLFRGGGGLADEYRLANVLISFNNKIPTDAIPFFAQVISPAARALVQLQDDPKLAPLRAAAAEARTALEALARSGPESAEEPGQGERPPSRSSRPRHARGKRRVGGRQRARLRKQQAIDSAAAAAAFLPVIDQLEPVLREISGGVSDFSPSPEQVRQAASASYAAANTLVLRFEADPLDESSALPAVLRARAPNRVEIAALSGNHLTPLTPSLETGPLPGYPRGTPLSPRIAERLARLARGPGTPAARAAEEFDAASERILGFLEAALVRS